MSWCFVICAFCAAIIWSSRFKVYGTEVLCLLAYSVLAMLPAAMHVYGGSVPYVLPAFEVVAVTAAIQISSTVSHGAQIAIFC